MRLAGVIARQREEMFGHTGARILDFPASGILIVRTISKFGTRQSGTKIIPYRIGTK